MLDRFGACNGAVAEFEERYPQGLDVSGLWGKRPERAKTWEGLLRDEFLRRYVGWAIAVGILPVRIVGDFTQADLRKADLRWADLRKANLTAEQREYAAGQGAIL